jgi:hypothetical protein
VLFHLLRTFRADRRRLATLGLAIC